MVTENWNLTFILRRNEQKYSYERRHYDTVAGKQKTINLTLLLRNCLYPMFSKRWVKDFTNAQVSLTHLILEMSYGNGGSKFTIYIKNL